MKRDPTSSEALIGVIEEVIIEIESAGVGIAKVVFEKKLGVINDFFSHYSFERFKRRLKYFSEEELNMTREDIETFFSTIDSSKKDMLIKIFNDANTATYDIHAYILSQIYKKYIKNDKLDFFDHLLINNIDMFTEPDFTIYYDTFSMFSQPDQINAVYGFGEDYCIDELRSVIYRFAILGFSAQHSQNENSFFLGSKDKIIQYFNHSSVSIMLFKYIGDYKKR